MRYLIILLFLFACSDPVAISGPNFNEEISEEPPEEEQLELKCNSVSYSEDIYRCENNEVICYSILKSALQCKFKKEIKK